MRGFYATLSNTTNVIVSAIGYNMPVNDGFLCNIHTLLYCKYATIKTLVHTEITKVLTINFWLLCHFLLNGIFLITECNFFAV